MTNTRFKESIRNEDELRAMMGNPSERARNKVISYLDEHCRGFIKMSPFLVMSTSDRDGNCDSSPRGDAPGFVQVIDKHYLVIPDRPGNKRMDSMMNMLANPKIGLLFMIPGLEETLRINGEATIIRDDDILEQMKVNDKTPLLGIAVRVEQCFIHCAKAFKRSGLWHPDTWYEPEERPKPARILAAHVNMPDMTEEKIASDLQEGYKTRLY
ncbi:pyridoxamine 5'-phosphate oxidase family protein [Fictibacillus nanhaiensis]|uniref:pyridoxamine 5'-phosphate oxidase family protein n=1 Tax=Fictibacillus nanhaiensis TaxID=742169 RepID=UPI001C97DE12|nr:pyridoxamine 5'-phosphate oxidase family protein [Fictibacillus nanhaiensis]MBY6036620.1 pyridoxamine 5'-phosphate oxidase family protein [Fictibacillus nanhaiensis]